MAADSKSGGGKVAAIVCPKITKTFDEAISSLVLAEWPAARRALKPHEVRVAVHACALNFFDLLATVGKYQYKYEPPYVIGSEASGVVIECGAKVKAYKPGSAVCIGMAPGVFASEVVVPAAACLPKPGGWSHVAGAAVSVGFLTGYHGLVQRGNLKAGEVLLVTGATGGMGAAAIQLGVALGATVIAACSGADKCALATSPAMGAHHAIDLTKEDLKTRVSETTKGKMADVVYEVVGGAGFDACVRAIAWNGRLLVVGFAGGKIPSLPANLALVKSFALIGVASGASIMRDPALGVEMAAKLDEWSRSGLLPPPYVHDVVPATQFASACTAIAERKVRGKIVIQFVDDKGRLTYNPNTDVKPPVTAAAAAPKSKL